MKMNSYYIQHYEENGLKRPLMAPRRKKHKTTTNQVTSMIKKKGKCWKCCEPFCYGLVALTILFGKFILSSIHTQ